MNDFSQRVCQAVTFRAKRFMLSATHRVIPALRPLARWRNDRPGITIVSVNYKSLDALKVLVKMVQRHSARDIKLLIVDNESTSECRKWLKKSGISFVAVPMNIGHSAAMDLGWMLAKTEFVVALDVDAFPIADNWLDLALDPLRSGALVSGARVTTRQAKRQAVHPCFLAMRRQTFLTRRLSFHPRSDLDVGESITMDLGTNKANFIEQTSVRGPGHVGSVFGEIVYHNFYGTRFSDESRSVIDGQIHRSDASKAWDEALSRWVEPPRKDQLA